MSPWILSFPDMNAICALSLPFTMARKSWSTAATVHFAFEAEPGSTFPPGCVQSTDQLREQGAKVDQVLCVIDRSGGDHTALSEASLTLRSLFTSHDLNAAS